MAGPGPIRQRTKIRVPSTMRPSARSRRRGALPPGPARQAHPPRRPSRTRQPAASDPAQDTTAVIALHSAGDRATIPRTSRLLPLHIMRPPVSQNPPDRRAPHRMSLSARPASRESKPCDPRRMCRADPSAALAAGTFSTSLVCMSSSGSGSLAEGGAPILASRATIYRGGGSPRSCCDGAGHGQVIQGEHGLLGLDLLTFQTASMRGLLQRDRDGWLRVPGRGGRGAPAIPHLNAHLGPGCRRQVEASH